MKGKILLASLLLMSCNTQSYYPHQPMIRSKRTTYEFELCQKGVECYYIVVTGDEYETYQVGDTYVRKELEDDVVTGK